ncbi:phosphate regulon sensor histidine kinase PhoR [Lacibacterium aquatile]|uniref:histidine kinase n=1 Tax=Lacibacterium aquatile TaxID=1168082 RepID=A0ABW5DKJ5_9PROT
MAGDSFTQTRGRLPFTRIALGVTQLVAPIFLLLIVGAWQGEFETGTTFLLAALFVGWYTLVARRHARALYDLRDFAQRLAQEPASIPSTARFGSPPVRDLAQAVADLVSDFRTRTGQLEHLLMARSDILDAVPDPVFAFDALGQIVVANKAAMDQFKAGPGRDLFGLFRQPDIVTALQAVLAGEGRAAATLTLPAPIEREFTLIVSKLADTGPDDMRGVMTLHDVTTQRRVEQTRADFVANASHEIRTPLTTLLGFIETLQGPARDDAAARDKFLGIMREQAERMRRLVVDLLSLSRIEQREHEIPTDKVILDEVVGRTAAALQQIAAAKNTTLTLDLDGKAVILGDGDELAQLVQNLIDNAIKYGRTGGQVKVRLSQTGQGIVLSVTDDGEGIAREHLPRLTERFYRVDPARSRSAGGTGLGLAIVKHIVSRHRGRLTIDSEVGKGTTFTILFPKG